MNLKQIQKEAAEWTRRNFPNQPKSHPFIGVIEEMGELADCLFISLPENERRKYGRILRGASELGQIAHRLLKTEQEIREGGGSPGGRRDLARLEGVSEEEICALKKDAVGDVLIFLTNYCSAEELDIEEVLETTWNEVKKRDWKKFPGNGIDR